MSDKDNTVIEMTEICPICLDVLSNDIQLLICNHKYHMICINDWINTNVRNIRNVSCPICNTIIVNIHEIIQPSYDTNTNTNIEYLDIRLPMSVILLFSILIIILYIST